MKKKPRQRSSDWTLGDLRCSICSKSDEGKNLCMAAEPHAKKAKTYLKDKTEEWKELTRTPGCENLHTKLSVADLKSNELFYHNRCWAKLKRDCLANKKKVDDQQSVIILKYNQMYCMRQFTGSF